MVFVVGAWFRMEIWWAWKQFNNLSGSELYDILSVRQQVFIVEQQCIFQDTDYVDQHSWHLLGLEHKGQLMAYARIIYPSFRYQEPSIGRLLTLPTIRGLGLGRQLMEQCLTKCAIEYPEQPIRIMAQTYLTSFYCSFGFASVSEPYDEDGIQHVDMMLSLKHERHSSSGS